MKKFFSRFGADLLITGGVMAFAMAVGCPIDRFFHISCPACGVTRAWLSFFKGDIAAAFGYNLFFIIIPPFLFLSIVTARGIYRRKWLTVFLVVIAVILFLYNIIRILL